MIGFLIGGWRSWKSWHDGRPLAGSGEGIAQIELLTTQDKDNWVRSQVYLFNDENFKQYQVIAQYTDSRAAMEAIIHNKSRPVLWSPDSPIWISRASDVWPGGSDKRVDLNDPGSFRVFLRSPVVFLTTRDKADFLRSRLGGQHPWTAIHDLATGKVSAPWGKTRFRHADPLTSNSGMLTLGMMLAEYARDHAPMQPVTAVAQSQDFGRFLAETEGALSYDPACAEGSAAVAREYAEAPKGCHFIVTYENLALAAAKEHPNLVAIYPNPTMVAEQSLCVLNAGWVSPQQRAGAEAFMTFVSGARALKDGLKYNMRPAIQGSDSLLDPVLLQYRERGFQQMFDQEGTPPYDALNTAAVQWNTRVKR
jgi:hypothetical protein